MLLEQLELVDIKMEDEGQKAVLVFLDEEQGEIREVNFNKRIYDVDKKEFIKDQDKSEKVDEWCQEYFNLPFEELNQAIGSRHDIHAYDTFNSMWESVQIAKFDKDMEGQLLEGEIVDVTVDQVGIKVLFEYDGKVYASNMSYSDYMEELKKWFVNPQKKLKQETKFETKFHVPISEGQSLIGKKIMVEVRLAMGKHIWADIKPFPKKK